MEWILNEAIDNPNVYWLEFAESFELEKSLNSQLDLPITPKAFQFCCFDRIADVSLSDNGADQMIFLFYLKHMKPQYESWSSMKRIDVKVYGSTETKKLPECLFKGCTRSCEFNVWIYSGGFALSKPIRLDFSTASLAKGWKQIWTTCKAP